MKIENVHCIYFSPTGNTRKSVVSVASGISDKFLEHDLTKPENRGKELSFNSDDIVIVGMPVYGGRIPLIDGGLLNNIKSSGALAVSIVNYGNRAYEDSLLELTTYLKDNGFKVIGSAAFIGEHSYTKNVGAGRPDNNDIGDMKSLGKSIKEKIEADNITEVNVDGNYPYKERKTSPKFSPKTNDSCIECGACSSMCPVNAISFENPEFADEDKCIKCCACIKGCPVGAKYMDNETFTFFVNFLEEGHMDHKQSQIFI